MSVINAITKSPNATFSEVQCMQQKLTGDSKLQHMGRMFQFRAAKTENTVVTFPAPVAEKFYSISPYFEPAPALYFRYSLQILYTVSTE
jgi:hypothetical protein